MELPCGHSVALSFTFYLPCLWRTRQSILPVLGDDENDRANHRADHLADLLLWRQVEPLYFGERRFESPSDVRDPCWLAVAVSDVKAGAELALVHIQPRGIDLVLLDDLVRLSPQPEQLRYACRDRTVTNLPAATSAVLVVDGAQSLRLLGLFG